MSILRLVVSRVALSAVTLLLVSLLIFLILEALPGDVATRILGRDATAKALAVLREQLHLGEPAFSRYLHWLGDLLQGNLGVSIATGRPIADVLGPRIANTLLLSLMAFGLYLVFAIVPAVIQATRRGSKVDHGISLVTLMLLSLPDFLLATILLFLFAVAMPILPALATVSEASSWLDNLRAMILPAVTLAIIMAVYAIRILRDSLRLLQQERDNHQALLRSLSEGLLGITLCLGGESTPSPTMNASRPNAARFPSRTPQVSTSSVTGSSAQPIQAENTKASRFTPAKSAMNG